MKWARGIAVLLALAVPAVAAASADGASGRITLASVSSDGTKGSFAGTVEWTGCAHPLPPPFDGAGEYVACTWMPYATVGPGSSGEACSSADRQLGGLGSGVQLVWKGEEETGLGAQSFSAADFALDGTAGKVLCLSAAEKGSAGTTIPCAPPGEPIPPGWHCPYREVTFFETLDSRLLVAAAPPPVCACNPPVQPRQRRAKHRRRHRHRQISLSQLREVPKL